MSKARGSSERRKVKRGKVQYVFSKCLERFFRYRITSKGHWIIDGNPSALRLSSEQLKKIKTNK